MNNTMSQNVYSSIARERERKDQNNLNAKNSSASMIITFHAQTPFVPIKETTKVDKVDPS